MRALDIKLWRDLWQIRGQAISIALITAVGTAAFVTLLGTLFSVEQTQADFYLRYGFADIFANARRVPEARIADIARITGVEKVTTRIIFNSVVDVPGMVEPINGLLVSAPRPGEEALNSVYVRRGRMVRPGATNEVVMTEAFADANKLDLGSTFHALLKGHRRELTVVGIGLSPEYIFFGVPGVMVPDDRRFGVLWMDHDALAAAFDMRGAFNDVALSLRPSANRDDVIGALDRILEPYGGVGAYARKDQISDATLKGNIDQLRTSIFIAAPFFLGVVAFLLHMLMMRHIDTERQHIGVLKAFGYSDLAVALHYIELVLIIVGIGLAVGLVGGAVLGRYATQLFASSFHFPYLRYSFTPSVFLQAVAVQLAAAFVGGMSSVRRAALLQPAVAMRAAPPPVYRRTLLERIGLRLIVDQPTRMILRHIVRWPLRSSMTVLGIALATAILLAPMGVLNSVAHMIDTHFFHAEREDLTIAFAQLRPESAAIIAIDHEPGVLLVQPFRAALADIRFGRRTRRITVIGRRGLNELSRPLLVNSEPMELPEEGAVISESMASWLGAGLGDFIEVQFLESRRPKVNLPIVGIAQSYVGQTFFQVNMDLDAVNRALGQGDVITGVDLKVDATKVNALYDKVKGIPSITGAVSHIAQLEAMHRITEQTRRMTILNIAFAAIILFGVVYNNARISFAERSRELATIRMLGFSQLEVSYILVGELALLTVIAIAIGCALGYGVAWKLTQGASNEMFRLPLWLERASFGYTIVCAGITVVISSAVVIWRVFVLDVISILKTEE